MNYPLLSVIFLSTKKGQGHLLSTQFLITRLKVSSPQTTNRTLSKGGPLILMWILPICLTLLSRSFHFFLLHSALCTLHCTLSLSLSLLACYCCQHIFQLCTSLLLFLQAIRHEKKSTTRHWKINRIKSLLPFGWVLLHITTC